MPSEKMPGADADNDGKARKKPIPRAVSLPQATELSDFADLTAVQALKRLPEDSGDAKKPVRNLVNSKTMAWALWDWGSAAFNAVATTFVFSVYLTSDGMFADTDTATTRLSVGLAIAGIMIALTAPISGQRADRRGKGTFWLGANSFVVFLCLVGMFFVAPNGYGTKDEMLTFGIACLAIGNIFFEFASVNYNAMLARVAKRSYMGRVSGLGWGMGYLGGIVLLLVLYIGFIAPDPAWFGITHENSLNIRVAMLISAFWFGLFALPVLFKVRGRKVEGAENDARESIVDSYRKLWKTVTTLARVAPDTLKFLVASAIFRDGLAGVFTYGAILASNSFGFSSSDVLVFGVLSNVVAGVATIAFGKVDDAIGPRKVIVISLVSMCVCGMGVFFLHSFGPAVFWSLGLMLCIFVGPTQSASRSYLARLIPPGREGEVFGLYATTGRAVSFLAPSMFALFVWIGRHFVEGSAQYWGILGIILILFVGLVAILMVKEHAFDKHLPDLG